jgi:hypothetical protein
MSSLDDLTGITEDDRQAAATLLTEKILKAGAFANQEDGTYAKQAHWMVYCAITVEDMCHLPGIDKLVTTDTEDRDELLHEAMLHFGDPHAAPWNVSQEVESAMFDSEPFKATVRTPASVYEGVRMSMTRFRAASEGGEVLGSWLEVWSSIAKLMAEMLSLKATRVVERD